MPGRWEAVSCLLRGNQLSIGITASKSTLLEEKPQAAWADMSEKSPTDLDREEKSDLKLPTGRAMPEHERC